MRNNPIEVSGYIQTEFTDYINSTYTIDNEDYAKKVRSEMDSLALFNGPFLHTVLPFEKGNNIYQLIDEGVISSEFLKISDVPIERTLYYHQEQAIRKADQGRNLVITTGTGSGKTESFLFPILNHIMKTIERGEKTKGVKAILLYPMNALVNDQRERIRKLLMNYPTITFGSFTGETPEKTENINLEKLEAEEGMKIPPNELLSRQEMRANPPDILFTNYSMLEYLLIRPADYSIISPVSMKAWQFLVLDEAHTYKGTLGIEISILLRRLVGTVQRKPQFILTSATLGDKSDIGDIIRFAHNLTSSDFSSDDILFATRIPLNRTNISYRINPQDYLLMKKHLSDKEYIRQIAEHYCDISIDTDVEEILYDVLYHDENVYQLFDCIGGTNTYPLVKESFNKKCRITDEQLTSLIQLIALASKNGTGIYDAKFHMFVSSPHKAYITLGSKKYFRFGSHNMIEGRHAFEIGTCKNCSALYIIGVMNDGYLSADDSVDVYENYDVEIPARLDFFLLDNDDQYNNLTEYTVCALCGKIWETANVNAMTCDCDPNEYVKLYHMDTSNSEKKNNITRCACCGSMNNSSGVLQRFQLNKDEATSTLTQIYFEGIGETEEPVGLEDTNTEDLFSEANTVYVDKEQDVKQMLTFSDSRQQASYYAVSFDSKHYSFLRRRLIWEVIRDTDGLDARSVVARISTLIREKNLFEGSHDRHSQQAWLALLCDVMLLGGSHSMEGNGVAYFEYTISPEDIQRLKRQKNEIQKRFNLNVEEFVELIQQTIRRFRTERAVDYNVTDITEDEFKDAVQYGKQRTYFVEKKALGDKKYAASFISGFLPTNKNEKQRNITVDYLMKIGNVSYEKALEQTELLLILMKNLKLFESKMIDDYSTIQISVNRFKVYPYTKKKWYVCDRCRKITPHNIHNVCPEMSCDGTLHECNPDEVRENDYYRQEYMTMPVENIVIQEHTAQLSREKARDYQKKFKKKKINILSSSTTFEMGVDIGSLENVFLRNMPPTPANYVQRAGRAGRSKDSSALIVTYCGNTSHDYSYFNAPQPMIDGVVKAPIFDIGNEKIVLRHILASALSFFFRKYPSLFKDTSSLVYEDGMDKFKEYLNERPKDLGKFADEVILKGIHLEYLKDFRWVDEVMKKDSRLTLFLNDVMGKMKRMENARDVASKNKDFQMAGYFEGQINRMKKESVIQLLSENAVIPKYGFPVDVVDLNVIGELVKDKNYNLTRDLGIAISEYAPGSEVIVDKNKYLSGYINLPLDGELQRYYYLECAECKYFEISDTPYYEAKQCPVCSTIIQPDNRYFIIPELGFSTMKKAKSSRTARPVKTYNARIKYIGGGIEEELSFDLNQIHIEAIRNDELLVMNASGFYYCPSCGFTKVEKSRISDSMEKEHRGKFGEVCKNEKLNRVALGHKFKTDVLKIRLSLQASHDEMISLTYALIEGISRELQIERNDINGLVVKNTNGEYEMILYDNVPGGAGHVRRIMNKEILTNVLKQAYKVIDQNCCDEETTCYKCLRNYYNQAYHKVMKRKYAKKILTQLMKGSE